MDDLYQQILCWLAGINPLYAFAAAALWVVFGSRIKALLAKIPLPKLRPTDPKNDEKNDVEKWLEEHPLLDRLWKRLKEEFKVKVDGVGEDDAYVALLEALRKAADEKK